MIFIDTPNLSHAYQKFGDVLYVDHWFKAIAFLPPLQKSVDGKIIKLNKSSSKRTGKPFWWLPVIQLENRQYERLSMSHDLEYSLITVNGKLHYQGNQFIVNHVEKYARTLHKKDWRIEIISAFESLCYQRQGRKKWVLIKTGKGYA